MFAFLRRAFVLILGFLLIFLFFWFAGPYFAFGPYRPLASTTARLIPFGAIVAAWLVAKLVRRLRAFRASDRLLAAVVAQPHAGADAHTRRGSKLRSASTTLSAP